jgi:prefoldin subunit 5
MRAELLAVTEECAESAKRFENKVNELNSVLEARNSKIQTLENEISSLKGQSRVIHERFKEEIKGNSEELTSLKGKVEAMGNKVSNISRDLDRIKKKQHQGHGESNLSKRKSSKNPVAEPQSIDANPSKHGKGAYPVENNRKPDSRPNKMDEVKIMLETNQFDILAVCETHLSNKIGNRQIQVDGYRTIRRDRPDGRRGEGWSCGCCIENSNCRLKTFGS